MVKWEEMQNSSGEKVFFTTQAKLVRGRHYYGYFVLDEERYRGWIMSVPGHIPEHYVDASTPEDAQEKYCKYLEFLED